MKLYLKQNQLRKLRLTMIPKPNIQNSQTTYSQGGTKESNKGSLKRRSCILRHTLKRLAGMHNRTVWHRMRRDAGYMGQR